LSRGSLVKEKVMGDPRLNMYDPKKVPFDGMRMFWGSSRR